ncbi:MAG: 5'-methylthioadenosine/adenosylhomocysteine nucleosidase [Eubacteriales bacterium]
MIKLGIIGAMEYEVSLLVSLLENKESRIIGKHTYYTGTIGGTSAVVARAGVGKVNAAVCTAAMIREFAPEYILNTGIAGALGSGVTVGDVIIADACVEYDLEYGSLGDARGEVWYPDGTSEILLLADSELSAMLEAAAAAVSGGTFAVKRGVVATGDRFVSDPDTKADILSAFPSALCCEMEGAAIAHVCRLYSVKFSVLRSMSDSADGEAEIDFPTFAKLCANRAAEIAARLAHTIGETK